LKEASVIVTNKTGLHARPAALLVGAASKFKSSVKIKKGEKEVNLKSLLSLLSLGICQNDEVTIKTEGPDENDALEKLVEVLRTIEE
jgi:phosphotransferase system HPr (HPr) family protein